MNEAHDILEEKHHNSSVFVKMINTQGHVYRSNGEYNTALKYFKQALELTEQLKLRAFSGLIHFYISLIYTDTKMFDEARRHLLTAIDINKDLQSNYILGTFLIQLSFVEYRLDNIEQALKSSDKAIAYLDSKESNIRLAEALMVKGEILLSSGKNSDSIIIFDSAYEIFSSAKMESRALAPIFYSSVAYAKQQEYKMAYERQLDYSKRVAKINNRNNKKNISKIRNTLEVKAVNTENKLLQKPIN